jgi:hypothetical protein
MPRATAAGGGGSAGVAGVRGRSSDRPSGLVDHLVFACDGSGLRRQWIMHIKARLRSVHYMDSIRKLYLERVGDSRCVGARACLVLCREQPRRWPPALLTTLPPALLSSDWTL